MITASDLSGDDIADWATRWRSRGNPTGGTVSLESGTITFVPTANLCGDDVASFDYTVEDGDSGADTGTVTIDLTASTTPPNAVNDTASTPTPPRPTMTCSPTTRTWTPATP